MAYIFRFLKCYRFQSTLGSPCSIYSETTNMTIFYVISQHRSYVDGWKFTSRDTRSLVSYMTNIMIADGLSTQATQASATMVLAIFSRNVRVLILNNLPWWSYGNCCYWFNSLLWLMCLKSVPIRWRNYFVPPQSTIQLLKLMIY